MTKKILVLAANPKKTPKLRLDEEVREIDNGLQRAQKRDKFLLIQKWAIRSKDFRRAMLDHCPNIVHFCGHGAGEGGIAFEDETGQVSPIGANALAGFFELFSDHVECVVLNACYSEVQAEAIAQNISYVIGMKNKIGDKAAIEFAVAFYDALGAGKSIEFAFKLACNAIIMSGRNEHLTPQLKSKTQSVNQTVSISEIKSGSIDIGFYNYFKKPQIRSIDNDRIFKNLSKEHRIDDQFIKKLHDNGWIRFAAGFKAGLYAHPKHQWCIKILGMGVGENPSYFFGRGYYLEHERNMLVAFRDAGFSFQPKVMTQEETIRFLVSECEITEEQAIARSNNNDILITEFFQGIPLLVQTGNHLECIINPLILNDRVLKDIGIALELLKMELDDANAKQLVHNDPLGINIVLTRKPDNRIVAKLVDFELAQDMNTESPRHVNEAVNKLYRERNVPINHQTKDHIKNLDQHLIQESVQLVEQLSTILKEHKDPDSPFYSALSIGPFSSGIKINLKNVIKYLRVDQ